MLAKNTKTVKEELEEKIIAFFKDNPDVFNSCIEELDNYNGYLGDDRYYPMDELDELFEGESNTFVLQRAFYGWDDDTWTINAYGDKEHYNSFNPNRNYFYFNSYGNLVSSDFIDYSWKLDAWAVESMSENRYYIDSISDNAELEKLFDELEKLD